MNQQAITDLSVDLVLRYYDNDVMPFLSHMDDNALWYGPAEGQFIRGRAQMIRTWSGEDHSLTFTVGNLKATHTSGHPATCEVMLTYTVVTHYPDGHDLSVFLRLQMSWCMHTVKDGAGIRTKVPRILVCHISNPHAKHEDDTIYAKSYAAYAGSKAMPHKGERIHVRGADGSDYFFLSDSIQWVEAAKGGKHSIMHTSAETAETRMPVSELARRYGHLFMRCHSSYLVNPIYIRNIRRFKVTMADGAELPIPEKKFTAFRDAVISQLAR